MGYSRSLATVRRRMALLAPLYEDQPEVVWHTTFEEAPRLAYKIQECLYIARERSAELPRLAHAAEQYTIRVEQTRVVATKRTSQTGPGPTVLRRVTSSAEIIQAWIDMQPSDQPLAVAIASLDNAGRAELQRFCAGLEPPWTLLEHGETVVLSPFKGVSLGNSL